MAIQCRQVNTLDAASDAARAARDAASFAARAARDAASAASDAVLETACQCFIEAADEGGAA
jgi:hypothetical protein